MQSKRALYIKEREGKETIETECGFIEFLYTPQRKEMYITDMYILESYRKLGKGERLYYKVEEEARERNCDYIIASYDVNTKGWQITRDALVKRGFTSYVMQDNFITLRKDL